MRTGKFIIGILLLCCFIRMVIGEPCTVPSGSMEPTLLCGDRLWINKLAYGGRFPSRWADIPLLNVFTWIRPLRLYRSLILRDGGKVMEKDGKIYIDGKSSSQYIPKQRFYYMEGDNRMNSHDSRSFGFISEEAIIGKFDFVLFSIDSQKQWWKAIRLRRMMMRFP